MDTPENNAAPVAKPMPVSPGRGKGNLNKATTSRTVSFRNAVSNEEWGALARKIYDRMMDENIKNADLAKLFTVAARFNLLSADAEMIVEESKGQPDNASLDKLKEMIKKDGLPKYVVNL